MSVHDQASKGPFRAWLVGVPLRLIANWAPAPSTVKSVGDVRLGSALECSVVQVTPCGKQSTLAHSCTRF